MTKKTAVIVGVGPGLGFSIARKFGQEGYKVALVSRKQEKLDGLVKQLTSEGIEAAAFVGDVTKDDTLEAAFATIKKDFGPIEVVTYSPVPSMPRDQNEVSALGTTIEGIDKQMRKQVYGAVTCAKQVIPDMVAQKSGSIILTTSGSGIYPFEILTPIGMSMAAMRNYAYCLNEALKDTGVHAGTVCINLIIRKGKPGVDPDELAEAFFDMATNRDKPEIVLSQENPHEGHKQDMAESGIKPVYGTDAKV